jgi:hypothetical protein
MTSTTHILDYIIWVITPMAFICLIMFFIWVYLEWSKRCNENE